MTKKSGSRVQRYVIAGILTAIPLWITWIVLSLLFRQLSSLGDPWVRALASTVARTSPPLSELLLHPWLQPLLASIMILVGLYVLGWVSTKVVGRQLVNAVEGLINKIPLVEKIYGSARKIISTLNQEDRKLDRVVLIDFPNETMKTIGFVTKVIRERRTGQEMAAVYVPTTPNPTSGYLEVIPTERLINTDMTVEQAMTFVVSGGTVGPDEILLDRALA